MEYLRINYEWLGRLLPKGFPYPSSTIISGEGGTGKPLVEFAFVASWLKSGGSVIGIPLQYPTMEFTKNAMSKLYNITLEDYNRKVVLIQLDLNVNNYEIIGNNVIKANLVSPEVWNEVIERAESMIEKGSLGTMVFGTALNLLLFSPTYRNATIKNIENAIKNDKTKTYIFSVSSSAFADEIRQWEDVADNLMFTRMDKPFELFFKISRMKDADFSMEEVKVPMSKETFLEIRETAEATRKRIIPEIMSI